QPASGARHHVVLVEDARHLQVIVQVRPHFGGQRRARRVADAEHLRAHLGKPARVLDHLGWKRRREEDCAHRAKLSTRRGLTESPRIAILPPPCLETSSSRRPSPPTSPCDSSAPPHGCRRCGCWGSCTRLLRARRRPSIATWSGSLIRF